MNTVTADALIEAYINARDRKQAIQREAEEKIAEIDAVIEEFSTALLAMCNSVGADSLKSKNGVASKVQKVEYWPSDWDAMYKFIKDNDLLYLLQKRINQTSIKQYFEDYPDSRPAWLNASNKYVIRVTRA